MRGTSKKRVRQRIAAGKAVFSYQRLLAVAAVIVVAMVALGSCSQPPKRAVRKKFRPEGPRLHAYDRVLIVAPHPDDETLGPSGLIQECLKRKIPVNVVMMTNGDGYKRSAQVFLQASIPTPETYLHLGMVRHEENLRALKIIGLSVEDVDFLSYADGSIHALFDSNWDDANAHAGSTEVATCPYGFAYEPGAVYSGENVVRDLTSIIDSFRPTIIIYPDPQDDHQDHWATSAFVEYVMSKLKYGERQYTYLVHKGYLWPFPWAYAPDQPLLPPPELQGLGAMWLMFPLTKAEEQVKDKALRAYASQEIMGEPFLSAFVRRNESFSYYPDIQRPPVKKKPDFLAGPMLPELIFRDPVRDTLSSEMRGFGDIRDVGFAYDSSHVWLAFEARMGLSPQVTYGLHLRIFEDGTVRRIDVSVLNGVATVETPASNSLVLNRSPSVTMQENRMVIELPGDVLKKAMVVMINIDTWLAFSPKQKRIDRTAWRRVFLVHKR